MKINIKYIWTLSLILLLFTSLTGQVSSRNGYWSTDSGTIRVFLVFAEAINDPMYDDINEEHWPSGEMPDDPGYYFDYVFNSSDIYGKVTKLYHQASFGKLEIIGDYLNKLIKIDYNTMTYDGQYQVMDSLQSIVGQDIISANNLSFNGTDFDRWQINPTHGAPKIENDDDYIDFLVVLWRVNSILGDVYDQTGWCATVSVPKPIKNKAGFMDVLMLTNFTGQGWETVRHELGHSLLGDNSIHTAGQAGLSGRATLPKQGGYSLMNYANGCMGSLYNGFDRWRLGWQNPKKNYLISALNADTRIEEETDLEYVAGAQYHDYFLRDFVSTGDVIRIELPHPDSDSSDVRNQYLWLENHQMKEEEGYHDLKMSSAKGIYAYIQVGWDNLTNFSNGSAQYLTFLNSLGNYDLIYDDDKTLYLNTERANPLTGYSMIQHPAYNLVEPNVLSGISYTDEIFANETFYPDAGVVKDGIPLSSSDYFTPNYPGNGTIYDPFPVGRKINIGSNPSTVPILTYQVRTGEPFPNAQPVDNKKLYLNGLSFEVLEYQANGDAKVRISYRDFNVSNDVRWCGPIVLTERVELTTGTITLDQGLTPTRPVNPISFNGEVIYASPTIFTARAQAYYKMFANTQTVVKNNSAYVSEQYGSMEINDQSPFIVKTGSTLVLKTGSNLLIKGTGHIEVESGGYICIETGAHITLQDPLSAINFRTGYLSGFNPVSGLTGCNCLTNPAGITVTGSGEIHTAFSSNFFIQNQTIGTDEYYTGNNISIGRAVDPSQNQGDVIIQSGANVIVDAQSNILLDVGLTINAGAGFEMR
jgi:hypothetical protein